MPLIMQHTTVVENGNPVWTVLKLQTILIIPPFMSFQDFEERLRQPRGKVTYDHDFLLYFVFCPCHLVYVDSFPFGFNAYIICFMQITGLPHNLCV